MSKKKPLKSPADNFMSRLDPLVRGSLSPTQETGIREAFGEYQRDKKHRLDIRGVIPLFFMRYYFVFLMGRDRRYGERESVRRGKVAVLWGLALSVIAVLGVLAAVLLVLHLLNATLGINLLPGSSFWRVLKFW